MAKIALITGGSSGLGFSFARQLGDQGFHIIILSRNRERAEKAVKDLGVLKISTENILCDVTNETQVKNAAEVVRLKYGNINFLILNAGEVSPKLLSDFKNVEELRKDLEVDLWGTIQCAYFLTPLLKEGSRILMTSSGFGIMGAAGYSVYCAAKAGIVNFAESLRRELLCKKIAVYVSCPGDMDTPQLQYELANQPDWMKQNSPRKTMAVDVAAKKILKKCKGQYRFLILIGQDVRLLAIVTRLLPRIWRDKLIDSMLPRPKK
jgi:NAD(P)-dependent dehydrogenase (short-subunit alcohol dehydrogenase family)